MSVVLSFEFNCASKCDIFPFLCRKYKSKPVTMTNHKKREEHNEPMRKTKQMHVTRALENACEQVVIGFCFAADWLSK